MRWIPRRRRSRSTATDAEARARAVMSELCPDGWTAQINVYGRGAPPPDDAPPSSTPMVGIEWAELRADEYGGEPQPVVARRIWAGSVAEALEAMVADRRLDLELEQIERRFDQLAE